MIFMWSDDYAWELRNLATSFGDGHLSLGFMLRGLIFLLDAVSCHGMYDMVHGSCTRYQLPDKCSQVLYCPLSSEIDSTMVS